MKITTRVGINNYISLVLIVIMTFFLAWSIWESKKADRNELLAREMGKIVFERILLRDEYLLRQDARSIVQWAAKTEALRVLLNSAPERFPNAEEKYLLQEAQKDFDATHHIFSEVIERHKRERTKAQGRLILSEADELLISQVFLKAYALNDSIARLSLLSQQASIKNRNRSIISIVIFVALCIAIIAINLAAINRLVMKRVATLSEAIRAIGAGHLDYRLDIDGDDELSDLGRLSSEMAKNLSKSHTSMENLQREVTIRKQAEDETRLLNLALEQRVLDRTAQLEAANKELKAFSYSVSHDLRGPLRGIDGFSQALLEDYGNKLDDTGKNYLERVCKATQHMGSLIDDMLKLSRITQVEIKREAVDLSGMIQAIAEEHQKSKPGRAVAMTVQKEVTVQGDPYLVKIAMENLVDNAWKFTGKEAQPSIEFGAVVRNGEKACFIRDNGAGFDMAYADKLFGAFQRLHKTADFPGTGIGLATVQRIIHRHGGQVWAEGETGKGATFHFTMPPAQAGDASR